MGQSRTSKRAIVKLYGRGNLLFAAANSVLIVVMSAFGARPPVRSEEQLEYEVQRDTRDMARRGYRLAAVELDEMVFLGARVPYARATWEPIEPEG